MYSNVIIKNTIIKIYANNISSAFCPLRVRDSSVFYCVTETQLVSVLLSAALTGFEPLIQSRDTKV
jgi:hypothetical protein